MSKNLFDLVVEICQDPRAADSDTILLERVWLRQGWTQQHSLYANLSTVSSPESITRARRKAHQEGLITYSKEALARREQEYRNKLDEYGTHPTPTIVTVNEAVHVELDY